MPAKPRWLLAIPDAISQLENLDRQLRHASEFAFYNTSRYDFERLLADAKEDITVGETRVDDPVNLGADTGGSRVAIIIMRGKVHLICQAATRTSVRRA